jgi:sugar lactone lactonase YvrE
MTANLETTTRPLTVLPVPAMGAEDVVISVEGDVYTGTEDGSVFRVAADGSTVHRVGNTGGRPLGLELLPDGRLLVCDARRGLLALDPGTGEIEPILAEVDGEPMKFCNNAAVAADGTIYFSDSSRRHSIERWRADIIEDTCSGRLLRISPRGEGWSRPEVLIDGLRFANGVALASDESFVCVAESRGRTVVRRWLRGPQSGEVDRLADALPGYPDNIALGSDGLVWVTIGSPTMGLLEHVLPRLPGSLRTGLARLPEGVQPKEKRTVRVMAFDGQGRLVRDCDCPADDFHFATGVRERQGRVWLGSLHNPAVAYFDL